MNLLLPILIIAIAAEVPIERGDSGTKPVFYCDFMQSWDNNFDAWPDGWTRRQGVAFPHYVKVRISDEPSPVGNRCLRIDLDAGAAIAYSPAIEISPRFSYVLEGQVKTESLKHDRAFASLTFMDGKHRRLRTYYSKPYKAANGWEKFRVGPIDVPDQDAREAVIGLHLQPRGGAYAADGPNDSTEPGADADPGSTSDEDLVGAALFTDIRLVHSPRLSLSSNSPHGIIDLNDRINVKCRVSGFSHGSPRIAFFLEDHEGRQIAKHQCGLDADNETRRAESLLDDFSNEPDGRTATAVWNPPVAEPGFYRLRAELQGAEQRRQEISFVIVDPRQALPNAQFGWSLPHGDQNVPLAELPRLMSSMGVGYVKYPLWYGKNFGQKRNEELCLFAERLDSMGIALVGVLDNPPREVCEALGEKSRPPAAEVFTAPATIWMPSLETVFSQVANHVDWWQLGDDRDASFVECVDLNAALTKVKAELDRIDYDISLGIAWNSLNQPPRTGRGQPAWRYVSLSDNPLLTLEELETYLRGVKRAAETGKAEEREAFPAKLSVGLQPLEKDRYDTATRISDLLRRMMTAIVDGADSVTIIDPFDARRGLFTPEGMPGELLLPWRVAANALEGKSFLGQMQLPNHSHTRLFSRGDEVVMVVWNERPCEETIYLGDDVYQIDVWGRKTKPPLDGERQVLQVGPTPSFVIGPNRNLCLWRVAMELEKPRIPCLPGIKIDNRLRFNNTFPQEIAGRIELKTDMPWNIVPAESTFKLAAGEQSEHDFALMLPFEVAAGACDVRIDCTVKAEKIWRFSVYGTIEVGLGDVYIEHSTELDDRGNLRVRQRFVNNSRERVNFRCTLSAPGRRLMSTRLENLAPGDSLKTYVLPDGKELIGKTLRLRGEEIGGRRMLNYEIAVKDGG